MERALSPVRQPPALRRGGCSVARCVRAQTAADRGGDGEEGAATEREIDQMTRQDATYIAAPFLKADHLAALSDADLIAKATAIEANLLSTGPYQQPLPVHVDLPLTLRHRMPSGQP